MLQDEAPAEGPPVAPAFRRPDTAAIADAAGTSSTGGCNHAGGTPALRAAIARVALRPFALERLLSTCISAATWPGGTMLGAAR